jgi:hypothetical protein
MIEKILNRFGYFREDTYKSIDELGDSDIGFMYAEKLGNVNEYTFPKKEEKKLFENLSAVDSFVDYLRATTAKDIQRYFAAEDDRQRDIIRGALSRTMFFHGMTKGRSSSKETKIKGVTYKK